MANLLKPYPALEGLQIGHATDLEGITGCTVILTPQGATGGVDVRGGASGSIEHGVLDPMHVTAKVHGVVLAGGSAYGLEASSGVRRVLEQQGIGFEMRAARVPIVPGAILYDLAIGSAQARPTREMGEAATAAALAMKPGAPVAEGCVGVGTGATFGKANGMECAMKGGFGYALVKLGGRFAGVEVAGMVALNAFGDVLAEDGAILAGARRGPRAKTFENTVQKMLAGKALGAPSGGNTTIAVVATNAKLTKVEANKMAQMAQAGVLRRIAPAHTTVDGDTIFGLSTGDKLQADINSLGVAAAAALSQAIERAVRSARSLGGVPALAEL